MLSSLACCDIPLFTCPFPTQNSSIVVQLRPFSIRPQALHDLTPTHSSKPFSSQQTLHFSSTELLTPILFRFSLCFCCFVLQSSLYPLISHKISYVLLHLACIHCALGSIPFCLLKNITPAIFLWIINFLFSTG